MVSFLRGLFGRSPERAAEPEGEVVDRVADLIAQMKAAARPCLRIAAGGSGASRLGGVPDLAETWPRYEGRPLSCVAQLDLAEMRAAGGPDWLPGDGRLMFFYELEDSFWGQDPGELGCAVVIHETGPAQPAAEPDDLPQEFRFPAYPVAFSPDQSVPSEERFPIAWKTWSRKELAALEKQTEQLTPASPAHQVGGFPRSVQADQMEAECEQIAARLGWTTGGSSQSEPAEAWRLLLQLDTDDDAGMMWGDTGTLYFWIREQDARAGDFSKTWMILQCC